MVSAMARVAPRAEALRVRDMMSRTCGGAWCLLSFTLWATCPKDDAHALQGITICPANVNRHDGFLNAFPTPCGELVDLFLAAALSGKQIGKPSYMPALVLAPDG